MSLGMATSAYQIEGAWNADGKGMSVLDYWFQTIPNATLDGSTGNEACLSYYKYREDVRALRQVGASHYRFSLSWSRLMPNGLPSRINPKGVEYYRKLIGELKRNNIEPMITLYHFDLPLDLYKKGGFLTSQIARWFGDYARFAFATFGDQVKWWLTFNQPITVCTYGLPSPATDGYRCVYNLLKAHAEAYHIYHDEFQNKQQGKTGENSMNFCKNFSATASACCPRKALSNGT